MNKIFEISGIEELRMFLMELPDISITRERLYAMFLEHSRYSNATEWNEAVRICEALAITGWGDHEPVEATRGVYFNGNPNTYFLNRDARPLFMDAVWSVRKDGVAIDLGLSFFHDPAGCGGAVPVAGAAAFGPTQNVALRSQRNWIPKNPIRITRGLANCYETSRPLIESLEKELTPALNRRMRPMLYGSDVDAIRLNISFSFYDNYHCKTNYIIADEAWKLKPKDCHARLLEMYTQKEIEDNGYYLRNRFTYGPFRKATGTARVGIVLEKEFSQQTLQRQKHLLSEYLLHAVEHTAERLAPKLCYDFPLMIADFKAILSEWDVKR